jgi:predicted membrane-bound spermidine synthase
MGVTLRLSETHFRIFHSQLKKSLNALAAGVLEGGGSSVYCDPCVTSACCVLETIKSAGSVAHPTHLPVQVIKNYM